MLPFDVLLELALGGRLVLARSARVPAATTKKHNTIDNCKLVFTFYKISF